MGSSTGNNRGQQAPFAIVVGVDFEPEGTGALHEGFKAMQEKDGAALHVVHVVPDSAAQLRDGAQVRNAAGQPEPNPNSLRAYVARASAAMPEAAGQTVTIHTRVGSPAEAILQLAADVDAGLIIVGTHGRHGIRKFALGSVAGKLVEIACCPVLIARSKDYGGIERTVAAEPVCPDCARARESTGNPIIWCEYHSRPQIRPHVYSYSSSLSIGPHDPGIVPPRL